MPASAAGFGQEFCSINQKIIEIDLSSQKKNVNKLFGFDKGLFILGDYSREQRLNAVFYQKLKYIHPLKFQNDLSLVVTLFEFFSLNIYLFNQIKA